MCTNADLGAITLLSQTESSLITLSHMYKHCQTLKKIIYAIQLSFLISKPTHYTMHAF